MAKFPIQYTERTISGEIPAVRANLDVSTGGQELGREIGRFGEAVSDVALRFHLMEASTQLDKSRMLAEQEHTRYMLGLDSIKDTSDEAGLYNKAFNETMATRKTFMPTNAVAAREYNSYLMRSAPQWGRETILAKRAKRRDNYRAVGFEKQQRAIESGQFLDYYTHLAMGMKIDAYDAEEVAKLKQATIEQHKTYLRTQELALKAAAKEAAEKASQEAQSGYIQQALSGKYDIIIDIGNDPNLSGEEKRVLINWVEGRAKASPVKTDLNSYASVKEALQDLHLGTKTRQDVLSLITSMPTLLSDEDAKSFVDDAFAEPDKANTFWEKEAYQTIESRILTKDPLSGLFFGTTEQYDNVDRAKIRFDDAIKSAAKAGKPLEGTDYLKKAVEIANRLMPKSKISFGVQTKLPPETFEEFVIKEKPVSALTPPPKYEIGQIVSKAGKQWRIVAFDKDGEPLVDEVK